MKYAVIVDCTGNHNRVTKKTLKKLGLRWTGNDQYTGSVSRKRYEQISAYCQRRRLKYRINNSYGTRSTDYRQQFFRRNPPVYKDKYFCAYCGRLVRRRRLTVDHLYPIGKASKSIELQKKLRRKGIRNINDPKNLVAACKRCNSNKGKKMGLWIIKGKIGRYPEIWMLRHFIRIVIFSIILYWFMSGAYLDTLRHFSESMEALVNWLS